MDLPDYHGPTQIVCPQCDWHEALPARRHLKAGLEHKAGIAFGTQHEMDLTAAELVEKIRLLPPADFEEFCADLFAESVYAVAPVDQATHTSHALELKQGDEITLVACRRGGAEHRVQQEDLENLAGAMRHHGAVGGIFLTTGSFTDDSRAYAEEKGIELIDAEELQERIAKLEAGVIQKWSR